MSDEVSHGIVGTPSHSSDHAHSGTSSTGSASRKRKLGVPRRSLLTLNVTPKRVCVEENPGMTSHTAPVDQGSLSDAMLNSSEMPVASSAALAVDTSLAKTPLPGAHRKQARSSNLLRPLHSPHPNASPLVALAINSLSQIPIAGAIHQIGTTDDDVKTPAATAKSSISRRRRALVLQSPVVSRPDGDRTVSSSSTVQSAGLSTTNALQAEITALRREIASLEKATAHVTIDEADTARLKLLTEKWIVATQQIVMELALKLSNHEARTVRAAELLDMFGIEDNQVRYNREEDEFV